MTFDAEQFKNQIPFYLTAKPEQKELVQNLDALNRGAIDRYYISSAHESGADAMLQGDGWCGFQLFSFDIGSKRDVRGIVLSNSCDISKDNHRELAPKIVFAPIVKISAVVARFKEHDLTEESITDRISAMKSQSVTNIFYLPAGGPLGEDYIAYLDDLHSMPMSARKGNIKLFMLSQAGFWLFVFKLSIHFCRLHENVDRSPQQAT